MTERLSHELACLLAEGDGRSDRSESAALLRARLARDMLEGVGSGSCANTVKIACALVADFVDGRMPPGERNSVAARLAEDAVAPSDLVSAVALLDSIEAHPVKVPAGLAARAVRVLGGHISPGPVGPPAIAVVSMPSLSMPSLSMPSLTWL